MSDISTVWDAVNNRGDWVLSGPALLSGNDLVTAVLISCFTDRVAQPDDVIPDGSGNPRGWWGDDPLYPIGSRMWLLERRKQDSQTLADAKTYLTEALQWMIDDGVVARIDILTEYTKPYMLGAQITLYKQDGSTIPLNFAWAWLQLQQAA